MQRILFSKRLLRALQRGVVAALGLTFVVGATLPLVGCGDDDDIEYRDEDDDDDDADDDDDDDDDDVERREIRIEERQEVGELQEVAP